MQFGYWVNSWRWTVFVALAPGLIHVAFSAIVDSVTAQTSWINLPKLCLIKQITPFVVKVFLVWSHIWVVNGDQMAVITALVNGWKLAVLCCWVVASEMFNYCHGLLLNLIILRASILMVRIVYRFGGWLFIILCIHTLFVYHLNLASSITLLLYLLYLLFSLYHIISI